MNDDIVPVLVGGIGLINFGSQYRQGNRVYDAESIAMCLTAQPLGNAGGYSYLYKVKMNDEVTVLQEGNLVQKSKFSNPDRGRVYSIKGLSPCINTMGGGNREPKIILPETETYRIRRLTPHECFRLMGVSDDNVDSIQKAGISNSRQYQLAGNSIVVDTLACIFRKLFIDVESSDKQLSLF